MTKKYFEKNTMKSIRVAKKSSMVVSFNTVDGRTRMALGWVMMKEIFFHCKNVCRQQRSIILHQAFVISTLQASFWQQSCHSIHCHWLICPVMLICNDDTAHDTLPPKVSRSRLLFGQKFDGQSLRKSSCHENISCETWWWKKQSCLSCQLHLTQKFTSHEWAPAFSAKWHLHFLGPGCGKCSSDVCQKMCMWRVLVFCMGASVTCCKILGWSSAKFVDDAVDISNSSVSQSIQENFDDPRPASTLLTLAQDHWTLMSWL